MRGGRKDVESRDPKEEEGRLEVSRGLRFCKVEGCKAGEGLAIRDGDKRGEGGGTVG